MECTLLVPKIKKNISEKKNATADQKFLINKKNEENNNYNTHTKLNVTFN